MPKAHLDRIHQITGCLGRFDDTTRYLYLVLKGISAFHPVEIWPTHSFKVERPSSRATLSLFLSHLSSLPLLLLCLLFFLLVIFWLRLSIVRPALSKIKMKLMLEFSFESCIQSCKCRHRRIIFELLLPTKENRRQLLLRPFISVNINEKTFESTSKLSISKCICGRSE